MGGGLGCVGDHCVDILARGLDTDIFIPSDRVTIFVFCSNNIFRCFLLFIRIVCIVKIGDTAESNVEEEDSNNSNYGPNVNVGEDESQADCSEDDTAEEEREVIENVD